MDLPMATAAFYSFKIVQLPLTAEVARPVSVETVPSWAAAEPLSSRVSFISTTATEPLAAQTPAAYPWPVDQVETASNAETRAVTRLGHSAKRTIPFDASPYGHCRNARFPADPFPIMAW